MASLRVKTPGGVKVYTIFKKMTTLGRDEDNDVVIRDPLVDAVHAHLLFDGKGYQILATEGRNTFLVNGRRRSKHKLADEDVLRFGDTEVLFHEREVPAEAVRPRNAPGANDYQKLFEVARRILDETNLAVVLENLMDAVVEITGADKGFLILSQNGEMDIKVARNINRENIAQAVDQVSDSIIARVLRTKKPLIVSDALNHEEFANARSVMDLNLNSVMCVPLLDRGNLIGLIYVGNSNIRGLFVQQTLEILTIFASLASLVVRNALILDELQMDNRQLHERLERTQFGDIVGSCPSMQEVYRTVAKVAPTDVSVLITGETGTGKELIARELHRRSARAAGPFVAINMGAIPESLLESELFGHVKGAFTGAVASREGRFQAASGGTLFLDEIGDMPLTLQVKLLRAIQERTVTRVGDTQPEKVDIRIVAATHRDLQKEVAEGRFREDLYYRINVVHLHVPPLRDRGDDILVIARYLLQKFRAEFQSPVVDFAPDAIDVIRKYSWPGNVREMENRIKRAIVLAERTMLSAADLGVAPDAWNPVKPLAQAREDFTRQYIFQVLERNNGNRTQTARDLGVDPRTIFRYLENRGEDETPV